MLQAPNATNSQHHEQLIEGDGNKLKVYIKRKFCANSNQTDLLKEILSYRVEEYTRLYDNLSTKQKNKRLATIIEAWT
jgi:hypothetical protein